jgi:hypothetical protein
MIYDRAQTLDQYFRENEAINVDAVQNSYGQQQDAVKLELNSHYEVVSHTAWMMGNTYMSQHNETEAVILSAFHKNLFLFDSAIELTKRGFYGPARTLLRSIFEGLIIAKYCSISECTKLFQRWSDGNYINIINEIMNKIKNKPTNEMRAFWKHLNPLAHATNSAQQVSIEFSQINKDILFNFSLLQILLSCNQHLMAQHWLTPSMIYYINRYGDRKSFDAARLKARQYAKENKKQFTPAARRLHSEYVSSWKLG